jgi:hypothetical protein
LFVAQRPLSQAICEVSHRFVSLDEGHL